MKKFKFNKNSIVAVIVLVFSITLGLSGPSVAFAVTSPSLGDAATYGVVSSTYTNSLNAGLETKIFGDVCYTTGPATAPILITGATVTPCLPAVGDDQTDALADLNAQAGVCTSILTTGGAPTNNLNSGDIDGVGVSPAGTYTTGCYSTVGAMNVVTGTTVTLTGAGTFIFKSAGALTTEDNSFVVLAGGASANDVFWIPVGATTIGANAATSATPTFVGNIFRGVAGGLSITLGHFAHLLGRTLAFGSTVTTDSNTITTVTPVTLNVIKVVDGGAEPSDFSVHVKRSSGVEVGGSPQDGLGGLGTQYQLSPDTYIVSEDTDNSYEVSFSGDCDANGSVALGGNEICTITNTHNPPSGSSRSPSIVPSSLATLHVIKQVVNNSGGTLTPSNFNLHVKLSGTDVLGSPAVGIVSPGRSYTLASGTYVISEDAANGSYVQSFSGACGSNGSVTLSAGADVTCTITNDDIALGVVLPVPGLPATGFPPQEKSTTLPIVILAGISTISIFLYFARKKQTT